jgi:ABC-type multidrug transport system fused ATPase/permease subunit
LIGKSGSGKTTLVNILLGFLPPQKGTIKVDGQVVNNDNQRWFSMFAYVPQDVHLVDDTIRRNIALGIADSDINEEKLFRVIKESQLEQLVLQLPAGVDTMVGERGALLSGGEKQRVALARALYYDREIVVMDEATAALDNETERQIVKAIKNLKGQKTLIVIAHRFTTVQHCDVIYQLDSGKIVAVGDFETVVGRY